MKKITAYLSIVVLLAVAACNSSSQKTQEQKAYEKGTFGYDVDFVKQHKDVLILKDKDAKSQVLLVPAFQGRILTSTANGMEGTSYGWVNYDLIAAPEFEKHMNPFGGEDRFWLGPEGGQYSVFFKPGTDYTFENWFTPPSIDTDSFNLVSHDETSAKFTKHMEIENHAGTILSIDVERTISMLDAAAIQSDLGITLSDKVHSVAFQSENIVKNAGDFDWTKDKGLVSIWVLGMYQPTDETNVAIPVKPDENGEINVNSSYFGAVDSDRLQVKDDKIVYFKGDGKYRSKIGIPPQNLVPLAGSYDAGRNILTIVHFTFDNGENYVNSLWEHHEFPYKGDVANSYNDGLNDGSQLGPFYELETSSSAKELKVGETMSHTHKTFHFEGDKEELNKISEKVLGVSLDDIANAFAE